MNIPDLTITTSFIAALSVAAEKLTEVIKNALPWLNTEYTDPTKEGWRKSAIQIVSILSGILTTWLVLKANGSLPELPATNQAYSVLVYGLLASAGSAFWNPLIEFLRLQKEAKENKVANAK